MKILKALSLLALGCFLASFLTSEAHAASFSFTGTLASPTSSEEFVVTLAGTETVTLQTYGFGGGTNAAGAVISAGGTAPLVAIFDGVGDSATILAGTSAASGNYDPTFVGCPPAGAPTIGGSPACGDVRMVLTGLAAGSYTIVLSDLGYIPTAFSDDGTLGEGFIDFTGGAFCNVSINGADCPASVTGDGDFALDIITSGAVTPEPDSLVLLGFGLAGLVSRRAWSLLGRRGRQ